MAREMRDSGVEWLGVIPDDWGVEQAGQALYQVKNKNNGMVETNLLSLSYGKVKRRDIDARGGLLPESFEGYNIVEADDIVLRFTDLQNDQRSLRTGRVTERGIITSAYTTVRPVNPESSRFLHYALHAYDLRKGFYGMGSGVRQGLKWQEAKYILLPKPLIDEQCRIADYLDAKCAEIDRAIEAAERSIEEYKRYWQSTLFFDVLEGAAKGHSLVDGPVDYLERVPVDWTVVKGKNVMRPLQRPVCEDDGVITCFRDGEVTLRSNRRTEGFTVSLKEIGYQGIEPGDLVVHGMDGFAGAIGVSDSRGKASPVLIVLDSTQNKRYLMYYLRAIAYREVFLALADGIRVRSCNLSWKKLGNLMLVIPPLEEQDGIACYLDNRKSQVDTLIASKQSIIDDLKAYKQSLVYEVVTGKREV